MRAGKAFEIRLATDDPAAAQRQLRDMCERLLANTVVEDYAIELAPDPAAARGPRP